MTYSDLIDIFKAAAEGLPFDLEFGFGTASQFAQRKNFSMSAIWLELPKPIWEFTNDTQQLTEQYQCTFLVIGRDRPDPKKPLRNQKYTKAGDDTNQILNIAHQIAKQFIFKIQDDNDAIVILGKTNPEPFIKKTHMNVSGFTVSMTIGVESAYDDDFCDDCD